MNLKEITQQRNQSYLFMALSIVHVLYFLSSGQMTTFYIIYIFWWDEFIRYVFESIFYKINQNRIGVSQNFKSYNYSRLIFLLFHWVLIYAVFGKQFPDLMHNTADKIFNSEILQFKNIWFNSYLVLSILKASMFWQKQFKIAEQETSIPIDYSENGIWVMHISIIMGVAIMFVLGDAKPQGLNYTDTVLIIAPFIILKALIEHLGISARYNEALRLSELNSQNNSNENLQ